MPIHVENMTSHMDVFDGEMPLSDAQTEQVVRLVLQRLKQIQHDEQLHREETTVRREAMPPRDIME